MEDLSLEELQAKFRSIQQEETSHRLSERNCVEIIMKLIEEGELQVIFTLSGKEYLTPKQLEREILDELLQQRGRISVVDLQPILNVDIAHIEKKVDDIVRKDKHIRLVEGDLMDNKYLEGVAEEINEYLQESGHATFGDLASRFGFPAELVQDVVTSKMGRVIKGHLDNGTLYTEAYVMRITARIRGAFSAITRPTTLANIISAHGFQENLFHSTVQQLIDEGRLNGNIQGRAHAGVYVPAIFSHARESWVTSFFNQNGYIDYASMEKMQYDKPRNILENKFKGGLALKQYYVSANVLSQVDGVSSEAIDEKSYIDIMPHAPSVLSESDLATLLENCKSVVQHGKNANCVVLEGRYVVSKAFLDECLKKYEQSVKEKIDTGKIKPELVVKAAPAASKEEDDEEETRGNKKGKGRQAKKAQEKAKEKSGGAKTSAKKGQEDVLDKETLEDFKKWFEDAPEEFLQSLLLHLRNPMSAIKEQACRAVFVNAAETRKSTNTFEDDFSTLYFNILLFQKGIQDVKDDEAFLEKHLLRTLCTDLTNLIVANQAKYYAITLDKNMKEKERTTAISQMPAQVSKVLQNLVTSLSGKTSELFLNELESVADKCQYQLKKMDKKKERQLLSVHRQTLMDQLIGEKNPATVFHLIVVLLYLKKHGVMIHAPGRCIPTIFGRLKTELPAETAQKLADFQGVVSKFLTSTTGKEGATADESTLAASEAIKETVLGKESEAEEKGKEEA